MQLRGKTAIVTGGGTGLGKAISLELAAAGANLALVYSRSEQEANETAGECARQGVEAVAIRADVSVDSEVRAMASQTRERYGRIDALVNCAGTTVFRPMADLEAIDEDEWDRIMAVNVKGIWLATRAAAPYLREDGGGAVVNIVSVAGLAVSGSSMAYAVSKAAAIHLTKCLALALAPEVRVNGVAPGLLLTRWWGHLSPEQVEDLEQRALLKKATPVEDVAGAVLLAITNDSLTGQTIVVDSGLVFH